MSENFKIIYKILKILEKAMSVEEFDPQIISAKALSIPEPLWKRIMALLVENGYISGVKVVKDFSGCQIVISRPDITLKGLEYLEENSLMRKAADIAKGLADVVL